MNDLPPCRTPCFAGGIHASPRLVRGAGETTRADQSGSALIVGMIFLLVMTMLGVTAMQTTSLEERMAGNMRDRGISLQAAELALRMGDSDALAKTPPDSSAAGVFDYLADLAPEPTDHASWAASGNTRAWETLDKFSQFKLTKTSSSTSANAAFPGVSSQPQYWFEKRPNRTEGGSYEAGVAPTVEVYEITARSTGASGNAAVVLRSTVIN